MAKKSKSSQPVMAENPFQDNYHGFPKYQVTDGHQTLQKAGEIRKNHKLMKAIQKHHESTNSMIQDMLKKK